MGEIKAVRTEKIRGRKGFKLFMDGMDKPTYHQTKEEALWAMRLRGHQATTTQTV